MNFNKIRTAIGKYKILFVIIASYTVVISLFLAAFFSIYFISQKTFRSYFDYNAEIVADNLSEKYDENIEKGNTRAVNSILLNEDVQNSVKEIQNGSNDIDCLFTVRKQLGSLVLDNDYLEDILIYVKNRGTIISSNGFCPANQYYTAYAREDFSTYEEFLAFLNETEMPDNLYSMDSMKTFSGIHYNIYKEDVVVGKIILKNDMEGFMKPYTDEDSDVVIVQDGCVLACSDPELADLLVKEEYNGENIFERNGKLIYKSSTGDGRRKCFYIMDMERMQKTNNAYSVFVIVVCIVCLLLCIAVCIAFMFFHYVPVKRFADFIKSKNKDKDNNYSYRIFAEAADYIETSEKNSEKVLGEKERNLREIYLEQWLLYKKTPAKSNIKIKPGQKCALIVLRADEYEQIFFEQVHGEKSLKLEMANFILTNVFDEEFGNYFSDVVKCKINDLLVWLVVFDDNPDWKKAVRETADRMSALVKKEFNISFDCYKSDSHDVMENLLEDFDVLMVEIKQKAEKLAPETASLLAEEEKNVFYYFPEAIKKQLYDSVESGNVKSASIIIDNILKYNTQTMHYGINSLKALAAEIYNTITLRLGCLDIGVERLFEENRLGKDIIMCENAEDIVSKLKKFIESMCGVFYSSQNKNDSVYSRTRRFIYQNYKNPQLSSTIIADELGLSRDYFLSIFKKESGMKVADYIHQIRIEEACKILRKTNHSITEIAEQVGYSNTKTFSRVFVKIMGVTPGVYREN